MSSILLFERNEFFAEMLLQIIATRFPRLTLRWVRSREKCLNETLNYPPDILILGVELYNGKELDLLSLIRRKVTGISIILLTDYEIEVFKNEAALRGADHVVSKEMSTGREILALVNSILAPATLEQGIADNFLHANGELLERPLERRKKGPWGRAIEREYLLRNPDRRANRNK